jgi:hypothetical protein
MLASPLLKGPNSPLLTLRHSNCEITGFVSHSNLLEACPDNIGRGGVKVDHSTNAADIGHYFSSLYSQGELERSISDPP